MRFSSPPRIALTDAQERAVLASIRCLDAAGGRVAAIGNSRLAPGLWSRMPAERHVAPDPRADREGFIVRLGQLLDATRYDLLLPGTDASLLVISRHRDRLPAWASRGLAPPDRVEAALDRATLSAAAAAVGLAPPNERECRTVEAALEAAAAFGLPVAIKPVSIVREEDGTTRRFSSQFALDMNRVRQAVTEIGPCIVQECARGPVISVGGVHAAGRLLGWAVSRYTRTWPARAGNVSFSETIEPPDGLLDRVAQLLGELGWEGLFELELITCADGRLAAIDFNPRAYGSLALAIAAGAPLPAVWTAHLLGEPLADRQWGARPGVRYRWVEADLGSLLAAAREDGLRRALTAGRPRRGVIHPYGRRDDPAPLLARGLSYAYSRTRRGGTRAAGPAPSTQPPSAVRTEQGWLEIEPHPTRLRIDRPVGEPRSGVLIVPAFGWAEMTAYRPLRLWALRLAEAGHLVVQIDLPGCGDSAGDSDDPEIAQHWFNAVGAAAGWLRGELAGGRVTGLGIGLGGLLVARAAAVDSKIDDLILWGVPPKGRRMVRELRAEATMIAARHPPDHQGQRTPGNGGASRVVPLELAGYPLADAAASELAQIDLTSLDFAGGSGRRALLFGRGAVESEGALQQHLERCGMTVQVDPGPEHGGLQEHPQDARAPHRAIATSVAWLAEGWPRPEATPLSPVPRLAHAARVSLSGGGEATERVITIELPRGPASVVLTEPIGRSADLTAVLWPAGALRRTGPNRAWVTAARRWAERPVATARVDLPGIGDAGAETARLVANSQLYADERDAEVRAVLDALEREGLPPRFVLGGLCSGAYWSLHAALEDRRILGLLLINLYTFWWSEELVAEREPGETITALKSGAWRRLLRGDVTAQRLRESVSSLRVDRLWAGRSLTIEAGQAEPMFEALDRLRDQGTRALMLFAADEPLLAQLRRQGHLAQASRWPNLRVVELPSRDHMFRARWLQQEVHSRLDELLDEVLAVGSAAAR